ncbi:hypothetical protein ACLKA6_007059 [Drosophila palustris]
MATPLRPTTFISTATTNRSTAVATAEMLCAECRNYEMPAAVVGHFGNSPAMATVTVTLTVTTPQTSRQPSDAVTYLLSFDVDPLASPRAISVASALSLSQSQSQSRSISMSLTFAMCLGGVNVRDLLAARRALDTNGKSCEAVTEYVQGYCTRIRIQIRIRILFQF